MYDLCLRSIDIYINNFFLLDISFGSHIFIIIVF